MVTSLNKIKQALFKIRNGDKKSWSAVSSWSTTTRNWNKRIIRNYNEKIVDRAKTHVGNLAHV